MSATCRTRVAPNSPNALDPRRLVSVDPDQYRSRARRTGLEGDRVADQPGDDRRIHQARQLRGTAQIGQCRCRGDRALSGDSACQRRWPKPASCMAGSGRQCPRSRRSSTSWAPRAIRCSRVTPSIGGRAGQRVSARSIARCARPATTEPGSRRLRSGREPGFESAPAGRQLAPAKNIHGHRPSDRRIMSQTTRSQAGGHHTGLARHPGSAWRSTSFRSAFAVYHQPAATGRSPAPTRRDLPALFNYEELTWDDRFINSLWVSATFITASPSWPSCCIGFVSGLRLQQQAQGTGHAAQGCRCCRSWRCRWWWASSGSTCSTRISA